MYQKKERAPLLAPKFDVVFHMLFGKNKRITEALISDIIGRKIKILNDFKDRTLIQNIPQEKMGILDLRAELETGEICNIEIQLKKHVNESESMLYYCSKLYAS